MPTDETLTKWASGLLIGLCGVAIGATTVALARPKQSMVPPTPAKPLQGPRSTVYRAGSKGHLYRVGINFSGAGWEPIDVAYVDELMAMRLRDGAPGWNVSGDGFVIRFADNTELSLIAEPDVSAPEQIGRLFLARGSDQVLLLLKKCKEIVDRGAGVDIPLEAIA